MKHIIFDDPYNKKKIFDCDSINTKTYIEKMYNNVKYCTTFLSRKFSAYSKTLTVPFTNTVFFYTIHVFFCTVSLITY